MRVAFDLDDTLIPQGQDFPARRTAPWLLRPWFREPLREGAPELLRRLRSHRHDIWLYTTSGRDPGYLRMWFLSLGVPLGGVVNWRGHEALRRAGRCPNCSKYPPAFGIDLLVDDSDGVALEGKRHGFAVLVIAADDENWTQRVLDAAGVR